MTPAVITIMLFSLKKISLKSRMLARLGRADFSGKRKGQEMEKSRKPFIRHVDNRGA